MFDVLELYAWKGYDEHSVYPVFKKHALPPTVKVSTSNTPTERQ